MLIVLPVALLALVTGIFGDPLLRLIVALVLELLAVVYVIWSVMKWKSAQGPFAALVGSATSRDALLDSMLRIPIVLCAITSFVSVFVVWNSLPWITEPATVTNVRTDNDNYMRCFHPSDASQPELRFGVSTAMQFDVNTVRQESSSFAIVGERLSFDIVAHPHMPAMDIDSIVVSVTDYKSLDDHQTEMKRKGYECFSKVKTTVAPVPTIYVEIERPGVGESFKPKFITWFEDTNAHPQVRAWDLSQVGIEPNVLKRFVVNIGAREPGIYTYRAEVVLKNPLGEYPPIVIKENRTVMYYKVPQAPQRRIDAQPGIIVEPSEAPAQSERPGESYLSPPQR